jgi:hypothetical protein
MFDLGEGIMARVSKIYFGLLVSALALAMVAAPSAHAFTLDKSSTTNSDGTAKYADPDSKFEQPANRGTSSFQFGGGTVTMGTRRLFDNDFNAGKERMLSPLGRPGDDR